MPTYSFSRSGCRLQCWALAWLSILPVLFATVTLAQDSQQSLAIATFDLDASPPVGSPLAYDPTIAIEESLRCRGVVILGSGQPIVLCAVDWIGISNDAWLTFKEKLAEAAGTTPDRVAVHALHQHDAPRCDFASDQLLIQHGVKQSFFDSPFARDVIQRSAAAIRN